MPHPGGANGDGKSDWGKQSDILAAKVLAGVPTRLGPKTAQGGGFVTVADYEFVQVGRREHFNDLLTGSQKLEGATGFRARAEAMDYV